jgi:hypothetical protein
VAAIVLPMAVVVAWIHLDIRRIKREQHASNQR